jgi:hypothetical protein
MDRNSTDDETSATPALEPGDYYYEGTYMVFTAAYHRKRGYCCESNCRHCPYREEEPPHSAPPED